MGMQGKRGSFLGLLFSVALTYGNDFLLLSSNSKDAIYRMDLPSKEVHAISISRISFPFGVVYDKDSDTIYWADFSLGEIRSVKMNGTMERTILTGQGNLVGMAFDPASGQLFYGSQSLKTIAKVNTDGSGSETIISSNLQSPLGITLDAHKRMIYWSDRGASTKIERANYDGSDRRTIVSSGLQSPNGIAIDIAEGMLYWVDGTAKSIESCSANGSGRQVLSNGIGGLYGLAIYNGDLFCTSYIQSYVMTVSTNGGTPTTFGPLVSNDMYNVYAFTDDNKCNSDPCQNGGTCRDVVNGYACICGFGYSGANCQTEIDECTSSPCQNGGSCVDRISGYACTCKPGFTGNICETEINECTSGPCQNGGSCVDRINGYTCICRPGFTGISCETEIDECTSSPCQNDGTCFDRVSGYACTCRPGFTGNSCETEIDECTSSPCQNGGSCVDRISEYACTCRPGFTGNNCETDECASSPCQNGGTCNDGTNVYTCDCEKGFSGTNCQTDINECISNPCHNGGTCLDGVNGFQCQCLSGYHGLLCHEGNSLTQVSSVSGAVTIGVTGTFMVLIVAAATVVVIVLKKRKSRIRNQQCYGELHYTNRQEDNHGEYLEIQAVSTTAKDISVDNEDPNLTKSTNSAAKQAEQDGNMYTNISFKSE